MKIGIIGSGNMGSALAKRIALAGHDVLLTAKDRAKAEAVASGIGPTVRVVAAGDVARDADIVIAATPAGSQAEALRSAGDLNGKTVIDIANPLKPDMSGLSVGYTTSFAEELAKTLPTARIVKAFNTTFAQVLSEGADFGGDVRAAVFYAGDDDKAKKAVHALIESMGFDAIDAGPLSHARYLEPMGMLNIWLGYMAKRGTGIAPTWLVRRHKAASKRAA
ncbi:MAG: NADPH-dependent F420 reductase [Nitrospiraceae bacterium]|nr:NADPH-dependent F420 reductase [Nitrospiraceae bacterium]